MTFQSSEMSGKCLSFSYNPMKFGFGKEQVWSAVRHNPLKSRGFLGDAIMKQRLFWGPLAVTLLAANAGLAQERPNIALILSDDQGWYGLSVQMHPDLPNSKSDFFHTPRLEELASQGMRFTDAYSPSPACSPTRLSIQNGRNPATNRMTKAEPIATAFNNFPLLPPNHIYPIAIDREYTTVGEVLQAAGYRTAHYGKWHLGANEPPEAHGYDESDGPTANELAWEWDDPDNPLDIISMPEKALDFIRRANEAGQPAFVQLSALGLHGAEHASAEAVARAQARPRGEMHVSVRSATVTEDLDTSVGIFMDGLDELGLSGNTFVIYMGDNGHVRQQNAMPSNRPDSPAPLMGGKGNLSEGGIRVPFIIRGPGIEANSWSSVPIVGFDFFPTFAEWARVDPADLPAGLEGGSFAAVLENGGIGEVQRPREGLVFHFPHYQVGTPQSAIRVGDYKLIKYYEGNMTLLFDLSSDIGERNNLAMQMPEKAAELEAMLDEYLASVNADLPAVNPDYDPTQPTGFPGRRRRGADPNVIVPYDTTFDPESFYFGE